MGLGKRPRRSSQERALLLSDPPGPYEMQINPCTHREETLYEMLFVHGQAKESNPALIGCCYMQCHAQCKTHLAPRFHSTVPISMGDDCKEEGASHLHRCHSTKDACSKTKTTNAPRSSRKGRSLPSGSRASCTRR